MLPREVAVVFEAVLWFFGFTMGGVVALPILSRIRKSPQAGFHHAPMSAVNQREAHAATPFTPLDLGVDPVKWPSAYPWPASTLAPSDWPSKSWNDEHFGQHWKKQSEVGATPAQSRPKPADDGPAVATKKGKKAATPKPTPKAAAARQVVPATKAPPPAPSQPQVVAPPAGKQVNLPTAEEVEALVQSVGLAATVQQLMSRMGWDFRQATQFLTKIRTKR